MTSELGVEPCPRREWPEALELFFSDQPAELRAGQVQHLLAHERMGGVSLEGLFVCRRARDLLGVILGVAGVGRTLIGWPPRVAGGLAEDDRNLVASALAGALVDFASQRRARFAQLLVSQAESWSGPALAEHRFFELARLMYLKRPLDAPADLAPMPGIEYVPYRAGLHQELLGVLERTYVGSHDCPALTGVRTLEEIFESHRSQGQFDPNRWFLVRSEDRWVGCLLLVGLPDIESDEVAYVATTPEARGRGLGRELTRKAIEESRRSGAKWLTLAVDEKNLPARRVYDRFGFVSWDYRAAFLHILDPADGRTTRHASV